MLAVVAVLLVAPIEVTSGSGGVVGQLTDGLAGGAFLALALVELPTSRRQALLSGLAGVAWFAGGSLPALLFVHRPLLVLAALAFPRGRLQGTGARAVVAALWVTAVVPALARAPLVAIVLGCALAATAWRQAATAPLGRRSAARAATVSATSLALALAAPAAQRAAVSNPLLPAASLYAALVAAAGVVLVAQVLGPQRETDLVIELTRQDPAEALSALRREVSDSDEPGTFAAAVELLETNVVLQARLVGRVAEVGASRVRLLEAAVSERQRLERQLSTGVIGYLGELAGVLDELTRSDDPRVAELAAQACREVASTRDDVDQLGRGLHPRVLTEHGLARALVDLAAQSPVPTEVSVPLQRLPERVETTVWYACAEAMANLAKHSRAEAARIDVTLCARSVSAEVVDDGVGGALLRPQGGLAGLSDRLGAVAGQVLVKSPAGGGTRVSITVPLP